MNRNLPRKLRQVRINRSAKSKKESSTAGINKHMDNINKTTQLFNAISHRPQFPIVITAYTITSHLGDYYQRATARLTKSCIKFNIPHIVFPLNSVQHWMNGCNLKPTVIAHAIQLFKRPVLWIDADAQIFKFPEIFADPQFDADMAIVAHQPPSGHWLSGTLYFKPSAFNFILQWRDATPQDNFKENDADEITLRNLWHNYDINTRPKLQFLPVDYNSIVHTETDTDSLTIGHYIRNDVAPSRNCKAVAVPEL